MMMAVAVINQLNPTMQQYGTIKSCNVATDHMQNLGGCDYPTDTLINREKHKS